VRLADQISDASAAPAQLRFEDVEVGATGHVDEVQGVGALAHRDRVPVGEGEPFLPVEGQHDVRGALLQPDADFGGVRNDEGAVGEGERADGCNDDARHLRVDDRTRSAKKGSD
jgi:hypothetical protein